MPITEIMAALTALRGTAQSLGTVAEIVNDIKVKSVLIDFQSKIIEVQGKFLEFQGDYDDLAKKNRELENKLSEKNEWNSISSSYKLHELAPNLLVYAPVKQGEDPKYFVCPNCFLNRRLSMLKSPGLGWTKLQCHACNWEGVYGEQISIAPVATRRSRRDMLDF